MHQPKLGFVGIGLMGEAMTRRLLDCGWSVSVWNLEPERLALVTAHGAVAARSPADVLAASDIVLLCVLDDAAVHDCVFGANGIVACAATAGKLVIDLSTISPAATRSLSARAGAEAGIAWVDAPVSGGPQAARDGTLTTMAGGAAEDVARARPILADLSRNLTHMGPVGAGQTAKILNQAIVGVGFVLMSEVALLAEAAGIDAARLPECLAGGFADSVLLQKLYPRIHARAFDPPIGYARQLSKDLQAVSDFARDSCRTLPLVDAAVARYAAYVEAGHALADSASIIRLYEASRGELDRTAAFCGHTDVRDVDTDADILLPGHDP